MKARRSQLSRNAMDKVQENVLRERKGKSDGRCAVGS